MRLVPVASCLLCLVFGCGGQTTGVRSDASAALDAAMASSAEAGASRDGATGASTDANEGGASCAWTEQSSVWIGQTNTTVTFPDGDYDGGDPIQLGCVSCVGASLNSGTPLPGSPPEKVAMILNPIGRRSARRNELRDRV
jgi:hypothetical protein